MKSESELESIDEGQLDKMMADQEKFMNNFQEEFEILKEETKRLLVQMGIPEDKISTYFEKPENFHPDIWKELENQAALLKMAPPQEPSNWAKPEEPPIPIAQRFQKFSWIRG